ncbi:MAG: apolipoprotein N-acyltransferase [Caulobacteraceae bacterium]
MTGATSTRGARPWAARGLAVVAGLAAAFSQPPWGFLAGLLGYALMLAAIERPAAGRPLRSAFFRGWIVGTAYFLVSLWWMAQPFQIDAAEQGWMAPFAVGLVSMFMALFWGAAGVAYRALAGKGVARVLVFAACLSGAEWLRGHLLTGFPWDPPGSAWPAGSALSQTASVVGIWGLTWITVAVAASPAVLVERWRGRLAVGLAAVALAGLWVFGAVRLAHPVAADPAAPWIRVVQADVKQETKYDRRLFDSIVARYVDLTARPAPHPIDIVVWPEGAIPDALDDYLASTAPVGAKIAAALVPGQTLLVGGYRFGLDRDGRTATFNTLAAVRRSEFGVSAIGFYDKFRLVPFGEFMPLDGLAARLGIKQMVHVGDGFAPGPPPRPLRLPGLAPVQPLICYESLFSGFTRDGGRAAGVRARWIANISNDAWFGTGIGPTQHLNLASYRAIEEGLPMVRATPTGISAVIDAYGRVVRGEQLGEGAFGVIDAPLPPALAPTVFDAIGDGGFWLMLLVSLTGVRRRRSA